MDKITLLIEYQEDAIKMAEIMLNLVKDYGIKSIVERAENKLSANKSILEILQKNIPVYPKHDNWYQGIVYTDGRKSADIYVGKCVCDMVVYSNWKCCPYCEKKLEWGEHRAE